MLTDVTRFRADMRRARTRLRHARDRQAELVAERAAAKASIESKLSERQQMLSSIKSEIAAIRAAEQRRQAELERQARARLAPQPLIPDLAQEFDRHPQPHAFRAGGEVRRRRRDRDAVPRNSVCLRRLVAVRLRLLGLRDVRLRTGRRVVAAQRGRSTATARRSTGASSSPAISSSSTGSVTTGSTSAGVVHPLAAHGRRGQDLQSERLVRLDLGRRPPPLGHPLASASVHDHAHHDHAHHQHAHDHGSLNRVALSATAHCLTGCAIGEVLG